MSNTNTERQKRAAREWINEKATAKAPNKGKVLRKVGYSDSISKKPNIVMESKGFKTETEKILWEAGITEANIAKCLNADIKAKEGDRLGELKLASSMLGMDKQKIDLNVSDLDKTTDLLKGIVDGNEDDDEETIED